MSILAWIGWIVLGILGLAGAVVLVIVFWFWRRVRSAVRQFNVFQLCPSEFRLGIRRLANQGAPKRVNALTDLGLGYVGTLSVTYDHEPVITDLLLSPDRQVLVLRCSNAENDEWVAVLQLQEGGQAVCRINCWSRFQACWAPGETVRHEPGRDAHVMVREALDEDAQGLAFPATPPGLRKLLAALLARAWVHRYRQGPAPFEYAEMLPMDHELQGEADPEALLKAAASAAICQICASAYIYCGDGSVGPWSEGRDRLLFVPESVRWADLLETGSGRDFIEVNDALEDALKKGDLNGGMAVEQFEAANATLPSRFRYRPFSEFRRPVPGRIYVAPRESD